MSRRGPVRALAEEVSLHPGLAPLATPTFLAALWRVACDERRSLGAVRRALRALARLVRSVRFTDAELRTEALVLVRQGAAPATLPSTGQEMDRAALFFWQRLSALGVLPARANAASASGSPDPGGSP